MIHKTAIIGKNCNISDDVYIGPFCIVGDNVIIEKNNFLESNIVIKDNSYIDENNKFYPFVVIGQTPQYKNFKDDVSKLGVKIGKNNQIREYVSISTGMEKYNKYSIIGDNNLFMCNVHLGHDCIIGNNNVLSPAVLVGGHAKIDDNVTIGGGAAISQFTHIGRNAIISGLATITTNILPFAYVGHKLDRIRGINRVGLKRNGFNTNEINEIYNFYKLVFNSEKLFKENLEKLKENRNKFSAVQNEILDFILNSNKPICFPDIEEK